LDLVSKAIPVIKHGAGFAMPALCVKGQGGLPKNDHIFGEVKDVGMGLPKP